MKTITTLGTSRGPWQLNSRKGTRVICPDGKLRAPAYLAPRAETFFSIRAGMRVSGQYVAGFLCSKSVWIPLEGFPYGGLGFEALAFVPFSGQTGAQCWPEFDSLAYRTALLNACPDASDLVRDAVYSDDSH